MIRSRPPTAAPLQQRPPRPRTPPPRFYEEGEDLTRGYGGTGEISFQMLANRIENTKRLYENLYGNFYALSPRDRRDLALKLNAAVNVLYEEAHGYAISRKFGEEFMIDMRETIDTTTKRAQPLKVLKVIQVWLERWGLYANSEEAQPDYGDAIWNTLMKKKTGKVLRSEWIPRRPRKRSGEEQSALSGIDEFLAEGSAELKPDSTNAAKRDVDEGLEDAGSVRKGTGTEGMDDG